VNLAHGGILQTPDHIHDLRFLPCHGRVALPHPMYLVLTVEDVKRNLAPSSGIRCAAASERPPAAPALLACGARFAPRGVRPIE